MAIRTLTEEAVRQRKVLLRVDFNVPLEDGQITDDSRIKAHLPTIEQLLGWQAEQVIVASHLSPSSGPEPFLLVAKRLAESRNERLEIYIKPLAPCYLIGKKLVLLENVRLRPGEEANNYNPANIMASLADIFVLDALSVAHRDHASVAGVPKYMESFAGPLLSGEVESLSRVISNPDRPLVVIIGGAKVKDKGPVIENLLPFADRILCGGKVGNDLLAAGQHANNPKVVLPVDEGLEDIGPATIRRFQREISLARTIVWAGPLGRFENPDSAIGTRLVALAVAESRSYKVIAGGDTQKALVGFGLADKMDFISQGGGATLEFLAGKQLPGLEGLGYYQEAPQTWSAPDRETLANYQNNCRLDLLDVREDGRYHYLDGPIRLYGSDSVFLLGDAYRSRTRTIHDYRTGITHLGRTKYSSFFDYVSLEWDNHSEDIGLVWYEPV